MVLPSDKSYQITKKIKQGKSKIEDDFKDLADWIENTYKVKIINIIYDKDVGKEITPRLNIVLEYGKDKILFESKDGLSYDKQKQKEIANQFLKSLEKKGLKKKKSFLNIFQNSSNEKYYTKNLWIFYSSFEPIAKMETSSKLSKSKIEEFKLKLNDTNLWEVSISFDSPTFFLYQDYQIEEYEKNGKKREWADRFFDLIKEHDEFNYFQKTSIKVNLDSKENFDNNYESNWYYYYK